MLGTPEETFLSGRDASSCRPEDALGEVAPVILAGGLGTRLRSALPDCPKVLAPVRGRPFIHFLLDQLVAASAREAVLLTGHGAEQVHDVLGETYKGIRLIYSKEMRPLGTAGALRAALPLLTRPTVLLMNGDSYCAVGLPGFLEFHAEQGADLSLVLKRVDDSARFGQVTTAAEGRITRFREKQAGAGPAWINAGVYLMRRSLLEQIPADGAVSLEQRLLSQWVESMRVFGYRSPGSFLDIGTPASYEIADAFFANFGMDSETEAGCLAAQVCNES